MAGGEAEHRPHHGLDAAEAVVRPARAPRTRRRGDLVGAAVDHRLEQRLLGGEPVEDRLLADARARGPGRRARWRRSRGCRRRPWRRRGCGRRWARRRSAHRVSHVCLPNGRQVGDDRRAARRQAHRHHRRHRLPRHRARRAAAALRARLRARPARPARPPLHRRAAGQARDLRQQRLRPPPRGARHATGSTQMVERPRHRRSPATSAPTGSASTTTAAPRSRAATSSSTPPPPCRSTRRSTPPSRSTCSARPASSQTLHDLGVTPHLVAVSTCYVAGNRRGAAPEIPVARQPVLRRRRLARRGRGRPPGPRRRRGREPPPRDARPLPQGGPPRARRRRHARCWPSKTEQRRERVGERPHGRGRPGPGRVARLARRLRLHQGARRAGAAREPRRRAGVDRAAVDHRVGARRARTRAGSAASAWPSR